MLNILGQFFYSNKYDYLETVISLCEVSFTILSILTIFISIYYENCILKLKKLKWKIKQSDKIINVKEMLFEYEYIKNEQIPFYDRIIIFFRVVCYILLIIYCMIYTVSITQIESFGGAMLIYLSIGIVVMVLISITAIFRTSKSNKDILEYKEFFNYKNFQELYNEKLEIIPEIKINVMNNEEAKIQIEQIYPFYMYNLLIAIQVDDKAYMRINLKDKKCEDYNQMYKYNIDINSFDINKYIFENMKEDSNIKIYISTSKTDINNIKSFKANFNVYRENGNTMIEIYGCETLNDRITRIVQEFFKEKINEEIYNKLI